MADGVYIYVILKEENGTLRYVEAQFNEVTGEIHASGASEGGSPAVLAKNEESSITGGGDVLTPVTLQRGSEQVAQAAALSLIGQGVYKRAETLVWSDELYIYEALQMSLCTADGSWASETYEKLGDLSEDYISFFRDGKWGYLKTVR